MPHSHQQGWLFPLRCNCNVNAKAICIKGLYARIDRKSKKNRVMQGSGRSRAQIYNSKADAD
jgi:cell division protein FtsN